MSSSPSGTEPATSKVAKPDSCKPRVNQTTCFAGPPTFRRAMILITLVGRTSDMDDLQNCELSLSFEVHLVGARFCHEVRSVQQALERSRVSPPTFDLFPGHRIARDVSIVYVGDFEFAATGRYQRFDDVVDVGVVHVNADDCIIGLRLRGFLVDANNTTAVESRHAETLRIGDFLQDDLRAAALRAIRINCGQYVALDDVVAKDNTN